MKSLETRRSEHRINKAINKLAPRQHVTADGMLLGMILDTRMGLYDLSLAEEYLASEGELEEKRKEFREKINEKHPEWYRKAPRKKVIVSFLNNGVK